MTVQLDWITSQHVEVHETGRERPHNESKPKSSSRRQLEEARVREIEVCVREKDVYGKEIDKRTDRKTDRQIDKEMNRQTDSQTDR